MEIFETADLMRLLKRSRSTIARWVAESRTGRNDFPLPFTRKSQRALWDADLIRQWIASRHAVTTSQVSIQSTRQTKRDETSLAQRVKNAKHILSLHAANRRKVKGKKAN